MREADGLPELGTSSGRTLGARSDDIAVDADSMVYPDTGGLSVAPGAPENLPRHRRPPEYGGTGRDPVWCIDSCDLPDGLKYRPDPDNPTGHGFLEPSLPMPIEEYQDLLAQTQPIWDRVGP